MNGLLHLAAMAQAACPSDATEVEASVERAAVAFAELDPVTLAAARTQLEAELGCLERPIPPLLVARAHGIGALAALIAKDDAAAAASLRSARSADPLYRLPSAVPEGHRLWTMLSETPPPQTGPTAPMAAPSGTKAVVDGRESTARPTDRPAVLWLEDGTGRVVWSDLYAPGEALPDLSAYAVAPPAPARKARAGGRIRLPLAVGSAVAAVGTGVLFGAAAANAGRFQDPATPYPELDGLRDRANGFTIAGSTALGATLALGTATLVLRTDLP